MSGKRRTNRTTQSAMRRAVKSVLLRTDGETTVEECRRCGKTIENATADCPVCGCDDIVTYRIQ
ncbi:hypothetical protein [Natrialba swarupiae]|uniref:Small CPxCG-related zinc finger protein n=1 Tax=Natrialba swarupiae TaxID=2448032 RepID=A0A5D5AGG4_9EURY|nr:hypothetical protein [Natrialba swarupiae]MCW8172683.1 hypothetical protein [Natrialba swarupiae]TYT60899.1 hypothetical protein FYC77_16410 [Natrialba swarupiae]